MKPRHLPLLALGFALAVAAFAESKPAPAPAATIADPALQAELLAILDADQQDRLKLEALAKVHGYNSPEVQALWPALREKDAANLGKVAAILDTRGWVGPEVVGQKASGALFLVIQHSDTATQKKYLPLLRDAVRDKKVPAANLALMEDRVALAEGRPQTYGSQLRQNGNDSRFFVSPLADPDHVDERRAAVGLPSMAENLKRWNLIWDVEAYKRELPELEKLQWGSNPSIPALAAEAVSDPALQAELLAILETDQKYRLKLGEVEKQHGRDSDEMKALWKTMAEQDAVNLTRISAILDSRGWLGPEVVGTKASMTLFLVVQHSNLPTQQKYLPLLRTAVQEKKASPSHLALLEDRVALAEGRPQLYGSQLKQSGSDPRMFVSPLEDPDHVDERRAAVGLPPMAEYLKHWNLTWDVEAYKRELPELEKLRWGDQPRPSEK